MKEYDFEKVPIVEIANEILLDGVKKGASDIHFDPSKENLTVRMRIDGILYDYSIVPPNFKRNMILPTNSADIINATYHSLAYSYKEAINELENITGEKYDCIYIVGGGAKNNYLNELTQKYTKKKVVALPIEATAIGNLLTQMEVYNER